MIRSTEIQYAGVERDDNVDMADISDMPLVSTAVTTPKGRRGVGPRLSYTQRLEIIEKLEDAEPPTLRSLGRDYGVDEKVIRNIKTNAEEIKRRVLSTDVDTRSQVFRAQIPRFPELEQRLVDWILRNRKLSIDVSPLVILTKAKQLAATLGISEKNFKASWGWYRKFKGRYDLRAALVLEEGGVIGCSDAGALKGAHEERKVPGNFNSDLPQLPALWQLPACPGPGILQAVDNEDFLIADGHLKAIDNKNILTADHLKAPDNEDDAVKDDRG